VSADDPGPVVLLTRPERESAALAAALGAEGWRPMIWPLLDIRPTGAVPDLAGAQAVLFTSRNAVAATPPAALPALCVGAATAEAARAAGFAEVRSAGGDAAALAAAVRATLDPAAGPLAFPRGETVAGDLAGALRAAGFALRETVVYAAAPASAAPPEIAAALAAGAVRAAAFYSPRTAAAFAALAGPWRAGLAATGAAAISAAAAAPLAGLGFRAVRVAERPDGAAMRAALSRLRPGAGPETETGTGPGAA
jgi:uroporphyrinogen-III synthase